MHHEFTPKHIERFWSYVDQSGGPDACWPWLKSCSHNGYGQFGFQDNGKVRMFRSNRVAYFLTHGEWPIPLACHTCNNRACCNPAHIYECSAKENTADMMALGRHNRPHAVFTDDEVREIRRRRGAGEMLKILARDYGVTVGCVCTIATRKSYRHVV